MLLLTKNYCLLVFSLISSHKLRWENGASLIVSLYCPIVAIIKNLRYIRVPTLILGLRPKKIFLYTVCDMATQQLETLFFFIMLLKGLIYFNRNENYRLLMEKGLFPYRCILSNKITLVIIMITDVLYFVLKSAILYVLMTTNKLPIELVRQINCILQSVNWEWWGVNIGKLNAMK